MIRHRWFATLLGAFLVISVLGGCSDDDNGDESQPSTTEPNGEAAPGEVSGPPIEDLDGHDLYDLNCATCHQANGAGIEGVYPPLADSAFVALEDATPVIRTVLVGRAGMPAWNDSLSDTEIAAILTYLRTEENDSEAVQPEAVAEVRHEPGEADDSRDEDESNPQDPTG